MLNYKRIRWLRQPDGFSCAPIAIMNLLKAAGERVTLDDLPRFRKLCRTDRETGSSPQHSRQLLRDYFQIKKKLLYPTVAQLRANLLENERNVVLLRSSWLDQELLLSTHLFLVVAATARSFFCVNTYRGHGWFPAKHFKQLYLQKHPDRRKTFCSPHAYVVEV
jgi:hypothetical protein